ncbi:mitochondrial inner membrane protease subunit 2-like isoform X2 [Macadamia integrifolia]|uniref:mitochondrial inner membrane protease subunit 2-like isoform X2 n=1 Tax=Macadamia integrifolia TaxID=60698 RepID=UPI001C4FC19B|nr:mitochondrial inner membrane protease subunit 2-like isoform X2 [Macadamia integrifolia]
MVTPSFLWNFAKNSVTGGLIALTISDRYASVVSVQGLSMHPTFNPGTTAFLGSLTGDYVLVEKFCLEKYKFSHGDVIVFRIPHSYDALKIPEGQCWVEGDNSDSSLDSRSFGPIPLGLVEGRVTHIIWPPQRVGEVERRIPRGRISSY